MSHNISNHIPGLEEESSAGLEAPVGGAGLPFTEGATASLAGPVWGALALEEPVDGWVAVGAC